MRGYALVFAEENGPSIFGLGRDLGFWREGATWWFAWNEREICLPALLDNVASVFDAPWDVARVFSDLAEIRLQRHGRERLAVLLLEEETRDRLPAEAAKSAIREAPFLAEVGHRLLAGTRLQLFGKEVRGRVEFPRPLDYGVREHALEHFLGVTVYNYYDENRALKLVRYAKVVPLVPQDRMRPPWQVLPYRKVTTATD
ncbi:MAG: hypothetical protein ACPLRW_04895 [Moorellales bacterium]